MEYTFVDREIAHGEVNGSLYGASVTMIARSPTHLLFHGLGSRIVRRGDSGFWVIYITRDRPTKAMYASKKTQDAIDSIFGENAGKIVYEAISQKKTVLFDGGGEALKPSRKQIREKMEADYAVSNINYDADLTGRIKTCRQCGCNLMPVFTRHGFDYDYPNHLTNKDDCQRMSNHEVVRVRDFGMAYPKMAGKVSYFETWDGESVVDPYFCSNKCAATYGYRAAQELPPLEPNKQPANHNLHPGEIKSYRNPDRDKTLRVDDKIFKI